MSSNIEGKVVVVTGASSGLGERTAEHLASLGALVVLAARREERLAAAVDRITAAGGRALAVRADVTERAQVDALIERAVEAFGRVDVAVANAGLMAIAPLSERRVDEWDRMIDVNLKGVLYTLAAALPVFERQGAGHFVTLASVAGVKVFSPGGTVYSGTKFAVRAIAEGLRHEAGAEIRSTIISPGAVDTELPTGSGHAPSRAFAEEFYRRAIPAQAVADAVAFAVAQPAEVDVNEIVLRPAIQEF